MKNLLILTMIILPLAGCTASIGTPPVATSTTYTTPAVSSSTTVTPVSTKTTVTKTTY
jgi:hypothetical protein